MAMFLKTNDSEDDLKVEDAFKFPKIGSNLKEKKVLTFNES